MTRRRVSVQNAFLDGFINFGHCHGQRCFYVLGVSVRQGPAQFLDGSAHARAIAPIYITPPLILAHALFC